MSFLAGTEDGIHGNEGAVLSGHPVSALTRGPGGWWAVVDGRRILRHRGDGWEAVAELADLQARCLLPTPDGLLIGTSEARLFLLLDGDPVPVTGFDRAEGRPHWYTPWGGPPDTRSLARSPDGTLYANVHVGGILRSTDGGGSWEPTLDIDADVHQVLAHPVRAAWVLSASARGLAVSRDHGATWRFRTEGLHHAYSRAVAVSEDRVMVSASTGPSGSRAALYQGALEGEELERCRQGLPDWFSANIDTHCLAASGHRVMLATTAGSIYRSEDRGSTWQQVAEGLPSVRCLVLGAPD